MYQSLDHSAFSDYRPRFVPDWGWCFIRMSETKMLLRALILAGDNLIVINLFINSVSNGGETGWISTLETEVACEWMGEF